MRGEHGAFVPSQVRLDAIPLVDTFGRLEREAAATILIRALVRTGNRWSALTPKEIGVALRLDLDEKVQPLHGLRTNPFFRPDFRDLAKAGYAEFRGDPDEGAPLGFTERGLDALGKWVAR
jgi:hypothetical protein